MNQRGILGEFVNAFPAVLGPRFWPLARLLVCVIIVFAVLRSVVADWSTVPSGSMIPTLIAGDRIWVNKLAFDLKLPFTTVHLFRWGNPKRGDIIIFFSPADGLRLVKRVIGIPGDAIELQNDVLSINGRISTYQAEDAAKFDLGDQADHRKHEILIESSPISGIAHSIMHTPSISARRSFTSMTLPPDKYFVMGDNRDESFDSRYFGFVDRNLIIGRTNFLLFSLGDYCLPRWRRMFCKVGQ